MGNQYTSENDQVHGVAEPSAVYGAISSSAYVSKSSLEIERTNELFSIISKRCGRDYAEKMKERNFLFGEPQPTNEEEFSNLDDMFEDAELSGVCTDQEFQKLFAEWN